MSDLVELVWIAPLAAIVVTASFALCVLGATKASDARREGGRRAAWAWMVLAITAGIAVTAEIIAGVAVIVAG